VTGTAVSFATTAETATTDAQGRLGFAPRRFHPADKLLAKVFSAAVDRPGVNPVQLLLPVLQFAEEDYQVRLARSLAGQG
jgi:hypothetical protein